VAPRPPGELAALAPEPVPDLEQAERVVNNFSIFWRRDGDAEAKWQLLQLVFARSGSRAAASSL
jgi:hypothetical protein